VLLLYCVVPAPQSSDPLPADSRPRNKLLASLPPDAFDRLRPHLRTHPTKARQVFQELDAPLRDVVFLNGGVASLTTALQDGTVIEAATTGTEGFLGVDAFFGGDTASADAMLQVPDTDAEFLSLPEFRRELDRRGPFFDHVQRYARGLMSLMMQSIACVAAHEVQERCCRWLLMTHDRIGRDEFQLSHEFLAMMLGSTRPTVTVVAGTLQKAGLLTYRHGRITILDRGGLESASCECYETVRSQFARLGL
jgi:CRP-like cAMP-binding protein